MRERTIRYAGGDMSSALPWKNWARLVDQTMHEVCVLGKFAQQSRDGASETGDEGSTYLTWMRDHETEQLK